MKIIDIFTELTEKQLDRLSEFLSNFSLLMLATLVLPNIFGTKQHDMAELVIGMVSVVLSLIMSLILIRSSK